MYGKKRKISQYYGARKKRARFGSRSLAAPRMSIPRSLAVVAPPRMAVVHNYTDMQTLTIGGAGLVANHIYRLGSVFDPDYTGVGVQPTGYNEYSTLYSRYTVFKAEVELHAVQPTGSTNQATIGMYFLKQPTGPATGIANALARSDDFKFMAEHDGAMATPVIRRSYYLPAVGGKKFKAGDANFSAFWTDNPTAGMYVCIWAGGTTDSQSAATAVVAVRIKYYTIWTEPKSLDES